MAASAMPPAPPPLIRHAVGKPAGCLCLELCEPQAFDALRAALPRLWRQDSSPGSPADTIRYLLPMLREFRTRLATARHALAQLASILPPAPDGATPLGAIAVARALLSMAADGSKHPGAAAARQVAPDVAAALEAWHRSGLADAVGVIGSDLALHAHTLAGHIRRALPPVQGSELLQGIVQMPPPAAIAELAFPARIERLQRIAAWGSTSMEMAKELALASGTKPMSSSGLGIGLLSGASINLPASCATASASSTPKIEWVQLLAQQLLITLWRLHRVGAIVAPAAPSRVPQQGAALATQHGRAAAAASTATAATAAATAAASRAAGALAPTFTRASAKPATRLAPQGALHRLGQSKPPGPALPFLAALIAPPSSVAKEGKPRELQLFHSASAPGFLGYS